MESGDLTFAQHDFLPKLGLEETNLGCYKRGEWVGGDEDVWLSNNPHDNKKFCKTKLATAEQYEDAIDAMEGEKEAWMNLPAPARGEIVRQIGQELRKYKDELGSLVSLEMGKIKSEGDGEVQEAIDICDLACGLSRSISGSVIPSERPGHHMMENWNPYGLVGVITAFNFPVAVYAWNACIALITGNLVMWKGAPSTPTITVATQKIFARVLAENGFNSVCTLVHGDGVEIGEKMTSDKRLPLISFTGSTGVGKIVNRAVASRFGQSILELGGNNATVILEDADLKLAVMGSVFGAVGTAGQRCTSLRRLYIQEGVYDQVVESLVKAYQGVKVGNPLDSETLMGPLHNDMAMKIYKKCIATATEQGGKVLVGGNVIEGEGNYVEPTIIEIDVNAPIVQTESFCPVLYVFRIADLDEGIKQNNSVPQGLSSSLFSNDVRNLFKWTGPSGSDCGIVNCNIGTSGAEIGGAFGGNKETGWGRESGSDAWKGYMRRSTCTINYSTELPLAQGVKFDI